MSIFFGATRREGQRRGHDHDHVNEYHEPCLPPPEPHGIPMSPGDPVAQSSTSASLGLRCRSFSRCCLKAGEQCTLPAEANGTEYHLKAHSGGTTAEMARPFPLGSTAHGPPLLPDAAADSLDQLVDGIAPKLWTAERLSAASSLTAFTVKCDGSLLQRLHRLQGFKDSSQTLTFATPMRLKDMLAAYYYRRVQAEVAPHVCRMGYCRQKWSEPCKFGLPCTEVLLPYSVFFFVDFLTKNRVSLCLLPIASM